MAKRIKEEVESLTQGNKETKNERTKGNDAMKIIQKIGKSIGIYSATERDRKIEMNDWAKIEKRIGEWNGEW